MPHILTRSSFMKKPLIRRPIKPDPETPPGPGSCFDHHQVNNDPQALAECRQVFRNSPEDPFFVQTTFMTWSQQTYHRNLAISNFSHQFSIAGQLINRSKGIDHDLEGFHLYHTIPQIMDDLREFVEAHDIPKDQFTTIVQYFRAFDRCKALALAKGTKFAKKCISLLKKNKLTLIPLNAWGQGGLHQMMMEFDSRGEGTTKIRIYNTGAGIPGNVLLTGNQLTPWQIRTESFASYELKSPPNGFQLEDFKALSTILDSQEHKPKYKSLYQWPLFYLGAKRTCVPHILRKPQSVGNCSYKVLRRIMQCNLDQETYQAFKRFSKKRALHRLIHLTKGSPDRVWPRPLHRRKARTTPQGHTLIRTDTDLINHGVHWLINSKKV